MDCTGKSRATVLSPSDIAKQPELAYNNDPGCGEGFTWKTLISASKCGSHEMTSGIAKCAPGTGHLCVHQHAQAELYYFMQGNGIVTVDGVESPVEAGSVVFIPGDAKHGVRNTDEVQELTFMYVFAVDDFKEIHYRFPHKEERYAE
jgi:mannose-6-phosphate isomerase-like protein (cupin superfamily)